MHLYTCYTICLPLFQIIYGFQLWICETSSLILEERQIYQLRQPAAEYSDIFKATEYSQPYFDLPSDRYTVIQDERRHNSSTSPKDLFSKDTRRDVQTKRCNTTRNKNRSIYIFILLLLFA